MPEIHVSVVDDITVVEIDNTRARNAFTLAMYRQLEDALKSVDPNSTKGLVLTGAGGSFASGTDITEFENFSSEDALQYENYLEQVLTTVERCPVPTIAAIAGACTGGGAVLAAVCNIRLATPEVRFGIPIVRTLGNCLTVSNVRRISQLIGIGRAQNLLLRAKLMGAIDALACGLITEIVAEEVLKLRAIEIAREIAAFAPLSVTALREAFRHLSAVDTAALDEQLVRSCYGSRDFQEGVRAFAAKRHPAWRGV